MLLLKMSPKKPVKSLLDACLNHFIEKVKSYLKVKVNKINFFNDFEKSKASFNTRCQEGKSFVDESFSGPLR